MPEATLEASEDDVLPLGDFFTCRDYSPREFVFTRPGYDATSDSEAVNVTLYALAAAATDFDLTGQIIWTCSIVTSWYVAHAARCDVAGEDVLELGAGCGLCGLTAAKVGARTAWLTDFEPEVLSILEMNAAAETSGAVRVAQLGWGVEKDHADLAKAAGREKWRVILGADVIYWSHAVPLLFSTVAQLLAVEGVFICGFTDRVNGLRAATEAAAAAAGLEWTTVPLASFLPHPLPPQLGPHTDKVTLFRFVHRK